MSYIEVRKEAEQLEQQQQIWWLRWNALWDTLALPRLHKSHLMRTW